MMTESTQRPPRVAVVGAGISGLCMAIKLGEAGIPYVLFEKADSIGGTWRDNAYPGLNCDVPGYVYTYSFARDPVSGRLMPRGADIRAYLERVFATHALAESTRFGEAIVGAEWDGMGWQLETSRGAREQFDVVVHATGYLHHVRVPELPGRETFAGEAFHSARWDQTVEWRGKRVGVIGNGSTGVQLVGAMAREVEHLTAFQRTPQWVFPMPNPELPDFLVRALRASPERCQRFVEWMEQFADWFLGTASVRPSWQRDLFAWICRRHLSTVRDPELRARLTPPDAPLCKRPVMSRRFYKAVQSERVTVVTGGIERIVPEGIIASDGALHPLDVIVYATGFEPHAYMRPMRIVGREGIDIDTAWRDGPSAYRTLSVPGFPNMFLMLGPHSPLLAVSIHSTVEKQADHIVALLGILRAGTARAVVAKPAAHARWMTEIRSGLSGTVWDDPTCKSWYLGPDRVPVLWPFKRDRWYRTLDVDLDDYELLD